MNNLARICAYMTEMDYICSRNIDQNMTETKTIKITDYV